MKLDLNLINRLGKEEINQEITISLELLKNTEILEIKKLYLTGEASLNYSDELELIGNLEGTIVVPCSLTLEPVDYSFSLEIEENLGNFAEILKKNKNLLDISELLCENIVLEIPMRIVKEGVNLNNLKGEGWELSDK